MPTDTTASAAACDDARYAALLANDARFDGQFFVGVRTTGIFCRVVCTARKPLRRNVTFHASAAAAFEAGFRPCLRCRPELAPEVARSLASAHWVARAVRLIDEGFLDEGTTSDLADRIGVTDRHLRRVFDTHLGASPIAVSQVRRLLFAKQLIEESSLPFIEVAQAAGYGSVRRFNDAVLAAYGRAPSALRARRRSVPADAPLVLRLGFLGAYDWPATLSYLRARAFPGVERVDDDRWVRALMFDDAPGWVEVRRDPERPALVLRARVPHVRELGEVARRVRQVFDLDANGPRIVERLSEDPVLREAVDARPGLRVPGAWHPFEIAVRAILGQQVSVAAATTVAARVVARHGAPLAWRTEAPPGLTHAFPTPAALSTAPLESLGIVRQRAQAIRSFASAVREDPTLLDGGAPLDEAVQRLCALPGIGPWTAHYIAMRALREPDAFPAADLGVLKALAPAGVKTPRDAIAHAERWRPWRAYAVMHLWHLPAASLPRALKRSRT